MPQRQNTLRLETPQLQGDGSFVTLRRLSWERQQEAQRLLAEGNGGTLPRDGAEMSVTAEFLRTNEAWTREILAESVINWNWVDDAGQPMPLPVDGGIPLLSLDEVLFLLRTLQPSREQQKN
jgi:hypothetical protein